MSSTSEPTYNFLLSVLPRAAQERIFPQLKKMLLPQGTVIYAAGQDADYVYFPTDAIISLLNVMADGDSTEISVVGKDGIVGIAVFMGGESTPSRAVVRSAGTAFRLPANQLRKEFDNCPELRVLMLRYTQTLIAQMAQTAVCNRHHSVDQQLCRCLLLSLDRLPSNVLIMTQELIANILGVRRESVTEAASKLLKLEAIDYRRGRITVLERRKLEKLSCECYEVVKRETDRLYAYSPVL